MELSSCFSSSSSKFKLRERESVGKVLCRENIPSGEGIKINAISFHHYRSSPD